MDNVISLRSRTGGVGSRPPATNRAALAEAQEILNGTYESIMHSDGRVNICHLAAVEKIKALLSHVACGNDDDAGNRSTSAMSMVELARIALVIGPEAFDDCEGVLTYGLTIAEALEAAAERLEGVAND
jgi:hypothetical protein